MRFPRYLLLACFVCSPALRAAEYRSGSMVYREQFRNGQLLALPLNSEGRSEPGTPAFELRVRLAPTAPELDLSSGWKLAPSPKSSNPKERVTLLRHSTAPVEIAVHTRMDGSSALTRWLEIRNTGASSLAITALTPWCGQLWKAADKVQLGYTTRKHYPWEGWFEWRPLAATHDEVVQEIGLGYHHPIFALHNETRGQFLLAELAWPANRRFLFDRDGSIRFTPRITTGNPLRVVAPGESVSSPALHLAFSKVDFDELVQQMHEHIRRSVLPPAPTPDNRYRVQLLMPEDQGSTIYRGEEYNQANLSKLIDVAALAGVELFILDGPSWIETYGEWLKPQPVRFPHGLKPLVDRAHSRNLLFGLYAEPEGGRDGATLPGTTLAVGSWSRTEVWRRHPDWFVAGHSKYPAPYLNLAIPEAAAYFSDQLQAIVKKYGIDLYRHDFCMPEQDDGPFTLRDGFRESAYWRHYQNLYAGFDRLRASYPNLLVQFASGAGTRLDLNSISHGHEHSTSDRTSTPEVYRMLSGLSVYLPPEVLVTPVGMADLKHRSEFQTVLRSAFFLGNTPVLFNSMFPRTTAEFRPADLALYQRYTKLYRDFIRPTLGHVKVYHHAPVNALGSVTTGNWFAMEFASPDQSRAWALIVRLSKTQKEPFVFNPRSLGKGRGYRMTSDNTGKTETVRPGASIAIQPDHESELLLFERVK